MARGSGNGDGKGRARKGRPVRARKAEAAWRLEKKETLHTYLTREVTVIHSGLPPVLPKIFFLVVGLVSESFSFLCGIPLARRRRRRKDVPQLCSCEHCYGLSVCWPEIYQVFV